MRCEMYKCRDNSCGVCTCKYPIIGENCTCLAYIPMESKEAELHEQIDKMTQELYSQLGLPPVYFVPEMTSIELQESLYKQRLIHADFAQNPDVTAYPDGHTEVSRPDGNYLDCKFQYLEDSDYWCSICPGNPEDI